MLFVETYVDATEDLAEDDHYGNICDVAVAQVEEDGYVTGVNHYVTDGDRSGWYLAIEVEGPLGDEELLEVEEPDEEWSYAE